MGRYYGIMVKFCGIRVGTDRLLTENTSTKQSLSLQLIIWEGTGSLLMRSRERRAVFRRNLEINICQTGSHISR